MWDYLAGFCCGGGDVSSSLCIFWQYQKPGDDSYEHARWRPLVSGEVLPICQCYQREGRRKIKIENKSLVAPIRASANGGMVVIKKCLTKFVYCVNFVVIGSKTIGVPLQRGTILK